MPTSPMLGDRTLELLADESMLAVLGELARGTQSPGDMADNLPGITRAAILKRLRTLLSSNMALLEAGVAKLVNHVQRASPDARYALTTLGGQLLDVVNSAAERETAWFAQQQAFRRPGAWLFGLLSDQRSRQLMRVLAARQLRTSELEVLLPDLSRSILMRRLSELTNAGVIERIEVGREVSYRLSNATRRLGLVAVLAARCDWQSDPNAVTGPGDLVGLLHLLAPVTELSEPVNGTCHFQIERNSSRHDVYLAARVGRVAVLPIRPLNRPHVHALGSPEVWCEALLQADASAVSTTGNEALASAVLMGISTALRT